MSEQIQAGDGGVDAGAEGEPSKPPAASRGGRKRRALALVVGLLLASVVFELGSALVITTELLPARVPSYSMSASAAGFWGDLSETFGAWHPPNTRYLHQIVALVSLVMASLLELCDSLCVEGHIAATFHVALTGKDKYFEWLAVAVRDGKQRKQGGYKSAEKMIPEQRVTGHTPFVESKGVLTCSVMGLNCCCLIRKVA